MNKCLRASYQTNPFNPKFNFYFLILSMHNIFSHQNLLPPCTFNNINACFPLPRSINLHTPRKTNNPNTRRRIKQSCAPEKRKAHLARYQARDARENITPNQSPPGPRGTQYNRRVPGVNSRVAFTYIGVYTHVAWHFGTPT